MKKGRSEEFPKIELKKSSKNHKNDQTSNAVEIIANGSWDYPKVFLGSLEVVWAKKKYFFCLT